MIMIRWNHGMDLPRSFLDSKIRNILEYDLGRQIRQDALRLNSFPYPARIINILRDKI